jgi:acetyl-CoA acetyltransferase
LVSRSQRGQPRDGLQQDNINISGSVIALGYPLAASW